MTTHADERTLVAWHEAGHAVACVMHGGTLRGVTLDRDRHGHGLTLATLQAWDAAFTTYAGAVGEALHGCGDMPTGHGPDDLNETHDDDGLTLQDHVAGILLDQPADLHDYFDRTRQDVTLLPASGGEVLMAMAQRESLWRWELARARPAISTIAQHLLDGCTVTTTTVNDALTACTVASLAARVRHDRGAGRLVRVLQGELRRHRP